MDLLSLFNKLFNIISGFLIDYFNWYLIILIYACLYYLYYFFVTKRIGTELWKRKQIIHDVHLYKMTHPDELYPPASETQMKSIFHRNSPQYPESYYLALEQIIKRWKGNPLMAMLLVFVQYMYFLALMGYFLGMEGNIANNSWFYFVALGLLIMLMYGRRLIWLKVLLVILATYSYRFFSMEALLFLMTTTSLSISIRFYRWMKTKRAPSK